MIKLFMLIAFTSSFYSKKNSQNQNKRKTCNSLPIRLRNSGLNFFNYYNLYKNNICIIPKEEKKSKDTASLVTFMNKVLETQYQQNQEEKRKIEDLIQKLRTRIDYLVKLLYDQFYSKVEYGIEIAATTKRMILFKKILDNKDHCLAKIKALETKLEQLSNKTQIMLDENEKEKREFLIHERKENMNKKRDEEEFKEMEYITIPSYLKGICWGNIENTQFLFIHQESLNKKIHEMQTNMIKTISFLEKRIKDSPKKEIQEKLLKIKEYQAKLKKISLKHQENLQLSLKIEDIIKREKTFYKTGKFITKMYINFIALYRDLAIVTIIMNDFYENLEEFLF